MTINYTPPKHTFILFTFLIGFIYRCLTGLQGIDNVDVGFCNTFYECIFKYPEANSFNFLYYLTGVIGGFWEIVFGNYGLLGFRFFEAFTLTLSIFFLYSIFKKYIPWQYSLIAISLCFVFPTITVTFHYDTFSYLLIAISAFCINKATKEKYCIWVILSGFFIGLSIFARIVNAALIALIIIPLFVFKKHERSKINIKAGVCFAIGIVLGCFLAVCMLLISHQEAYYIDAIQQAFCTLSNNNATHSKGNIIYKYFKSGINIALTIMVLLIIAKLTTIKQIKKYKDHILTKILLTIIIFILAYTSLPYTVALACSLLLCLYAIINKNIEEGKVVVSYLIIATLIFPIGSDIGIAGVYNWIAGMAIFPAAYCYTKISKKWNSLLLITILCIGLSGIIKQAFKAYGAVKPRWKETTLVQNDRLNIYTDSANALQYQQVIKAINKEQDSNWRLLFLINQKSEYYYATHSLPFLGHTQTVIYTGQSLIDRLNERKAFFKSYPLIVELKKVKPLSETEEVSKLTHIWMKKQKYSVVYSDSYCTIYKRK